MISVSAAVAAAALTNGIANEGPADAPLECVILAVDGRAGPLLVGLPESRRADAAAPVKGQWGQAALRPYDVMSSLGAGNVPSVPQGLTMADAPVPLTVGSPIAWVLAGAGLLGMLYLRRSSA
jgi:hypothetical protein